MNGQDLSGSVLRVDMATATPAERDQKLAVFIGNIPFSVEEDDVRKHFECCGEVRNDVMKLPLKSKSGVSNTRLAGRMWPTRHVYAARVIIKVILIIDKTTVL